MSRSMLVVAAMLVAEPAWADTVAKGTVVKVEVGEIYVNLGSKAGVESGARLRIKRPIKLKHPVSRKWVTDWLPVGGADVTDPGERLSMAVLDAELLAEVRVGDVVEIYVEREEHVEVEPPPPRKPPAKTPVDDRPLPEIDAETAAVLAVWNAQRDVGLDARITAWEGYLAAHTGSPHADAIREDLELLRRHRDTLTPPSTTAVRNVTGVAHNAPTRAVPGVAVPLVFVLDDPAAVSSAWLHVRAVDDRSYQRILLEREGTRYLRGEIAAGAVVAPGVEYMLEVISPGGEPGIAVNESIAVEKPALAERFAPRRQRTRVATMVSWLDFATFDERDGDHTDRYFQLETDVTYRLDGPLAGLSAGLGMIQGEGGRANEAWTTINPAPHTGFEYGYAEGELRVGRNLGAAARLIAGVGQDGLGMGFEGRVRIGDIDGTSLSVTASQIAELGHLSQVRFQVDPFGKVPLGFSVGVTDRPARGDLAIRLGVDIGTRWLPWLEPVLRLTYQGRTVEHSGVGAGLGLNFHW